MIAWVRVVVAATTWARACSVGGSVRPWVRIGVVGGCRSWRGSGAALGARVGGSVVVAWGSVTLVVSVARVWSRLLHGDYHLTAWLFD